MVNTSSGQVYTSFDNENGDIIHFNNSVYNKLVTNSLTSIINNDFISNWFVISLRERLDKIILLTQPLSLPTGVYPTNLGISVPSGVYPTNILGITVPSGVYPTNIST